MSKITENLLVNRARGKMGNQFVYKTRGGHTFLSRLPTFPADLAPTEKQVKARDSFSEASFYARKAVANAELKLEYESMLGPGKSAYNAACRDYLKAPVVISIDISNYSGLALTPIVVMAEDDFRVAEVFVSIRTATGELVEEGLAMPHPIYRKKWTYTTMRNHPAIAGGKIAVRARDLPGNEGTLDKTL